MERKEITVSYSRKVQLDDFEPVEHYTEITADVEPEDDLHAVHESLTDDVEDMVERAIAHRVTQKKLESDDDE